MQINLRETDALQLEISGVEHLLWIEKQSAKLTHIDVQLQHQFNVSRYPLRPVRSLSSVLAMVATHDLSALLWPGNLLLYDIELSFLTCCLL